MHMCCVAIMCVLGVSEHDPHSAEPCVSVVVQVLFSARKGTLHWLACRSALDVPNTERVATVCANPWLYAASGVIKADDILEIMCRTHCLTTMLTTLSMLYAIYVFCICMQL